MNWLMVHFTLIEAVDLNKLCVPLTVKLLHQWSGVDFNEQSVSNESWKAPQLNSKPSQ